MTKKASVSPCNIEKYIDGDVQQLMDLVATEEPMEIRIGFGDAQNRKQKSISVTMRTPGNDFELAVGFLLTEGIILNTNQIRSVNYCTELNTKENHENIVRVELEPEVEIDFKQLQRNFYTTSSCGVCGKESIEAIRTKCEIRNANYELRITKEVILSLPEKLRQQQLVFEHTGGLHACALFSNNGDLLLLREDVGRHNAMDKLVGAVLSNKTNPINLGASILLLSGRASFELIQKAAMAGIYAVCAVGAPSSLAVETAKEFGITLIGFLRQNKFNVYNNFSVLL